MTPGTPRLPRRLAWTALLLTGALCRCECEPDNLGDIKCEFTVDPHDLGGSSPIDFGDVPIGTRRTRTVTLENTGAVHLAEVQFDFGGQNGEHFTLGATLPSLTVGAQVSVPIVFAPQVVAAELNHTVVVSHADVQGVPCSAYTVSLRGGSFEIPESDAGVDAGDPDAGEDAGQDAGRDAGPFIPVRDAGAAFDGAGGFVAVAALQDPRSHFAAAPVEDGGVLVGGGYGPAGETLASVEQVSARSGSSRVVASFGAGQGRAQLSATRMSDGRVVFIGGLLPGADDLALPTDEVMIYTPQSGALTPTANPIITPRFGHTAVALAADELLVAFGETRDAVSEPAYPVGAPQRVFLDARRPVEVEEASAGAADARAETSATLLDDGRVVFVGGRDPGGAALGSVVVFDGAQLDVTAAVLAEPRFGHAAAQLAGGRVVVVGGADSDGTPRTTLELLDTAGDPSTWSFSTLRDDLAPRVHPMAAALGDQTVLVAGGAPLPELEGAEPQRARDDGQLLIDLGGSFLLTSPANHLAVPRWRGQLVVIGDTALFLGGSSTTRRRSPLPSIERFTLEEGRFDHFGLFGPGAAALSTMDGRLMAAGGLDPHTDLPTARTRFYRADGERFSDGPALTTARLHHSATLIDFGLVLVVGGTDLNGAALASCELVDLPRGTATPAASLQHARGRHSATLLDDGTVLVCGGVGASGDALESCERYDPGAQTGEPDDDVVTLVPGYMSAARLGHQATWLDDGRVLLTGGVDPARGVRHDDLYDPEADAIMPVAGLPDLARRHHVAVLIGMGRVLLAGGEVFNGAYVATDSAELYDVGVDGYLDLPPMVTQRIGPAALLFQGGVVLLAGGVRPTTSTPERPSLSMRASELFDPASGVHGSFTAVEMPLRAPRGLALGTQIVDQPLVLFGESRDGRLAGGGEQRTFHVSLERWDPEVQP